MKPIHTILTLMIVSLSACIGLDLNEISEDLIYSPELAIPIGKIDAQFISINQLPIELPDTPEPLTFTKNDTVFFELAENVESPKQIVRVILKINSTNSFPAGIRIQMAYEDFDGSFIDLTQDHPIYLSPVEVNLEGNIINTNVQVTEFELSKEQIDGLLSVGRIIFMSTFEDFILDQTTQQKLQKYSVKISSGARVLLRVDSKEV